MPTEPLVIENARLVLPDHLLHGWLAVADGRIVEIGEGRAPERGLDLAGDWLLPGLVELHTDHLESHYAPRPKVRWHALGAVLAYDSQIAASGITTVFDSLRAGSDLDGGGLAAELMDLAGAIDEARQQDLFRAEHHTHLRCEVPSPDVVAMTQAFLARHSVGLISLMDHTPGQRQFRDIEKYFIYYGGKHGYSSRTGTGMDELEAMVARKMRDGARLAEAARPKLIELARQNGVMLASHDDTTAQDVAQSVAEGVAIAEFPTTLESASLSREAGLVTVMGAPNLIRGGSHSGNVAAETLAREGVLDVLSSDYVPGSLLMAAFALPGKVETIALPQAVAMVTANPARAAGLGDRGRLETGLRADLVRVGQAGDVPVVRQVWRQGARVA